LDKKYWINMIKSFYNKAFVDLLILVAVLVVILNFKGGVYNIFLGFISIVTIVRLTNHWN